MSDNPLSQDTSASLVDRAKAIIVRPKEEWPRIAAEPTSQNDVLLRYALPLIAIGPICGLIGGQVFGYGGMGFHLRPSLGFSVGTAIASFVMGVIGLFLISFIANLLAPRFGGREDWLRAFKLVTYSMTPAWLVGVFSLIPMLGILAILGLYSFYLFYLGSSRMLSVPEDQAGGYTAVTIIVGIVVFIVLGLISTALVGGPANFL